MSTPTTRLRGVTRVYALHMATAGLRLVLHKRVQLGKAPTVQSPLVIDVLVLFAAAHLGGLADVGEVFQDESSTCRSGLHDALTQYVIMIFALPKPFSTQLLEMSLSRFGAFGLQFSSQTEDTPFLFFPPSLSQEDTGGRDCWSIKSQVNADHLLGGRDSWFRNGDDDVQGKASLAIAQIGSADLVSSVLREVSRNAKGQFNTPVYRSKATSECFPLDPVRTLIITDTGQRTVRTFHWLEDGGRFAELEGFSDLLRKCRRFLLLPGQGRFYALGGTYTGGTDHLCGKLGKLGSEGIIGTFMQLNPRYCTAW